MMIDVWCIEDDDAMFGFIEQHFNDIASGKFRLKRVTSLPKALKLTGHPSIILVDTTAIAGGIQPTGCWHLFESNLGYLAERHLSAVFGIYSAVGGWAENLVDNIKERFKDVVITQTKPTDLHYLKDFLQKSGFLPEEAPNVEKT